MVRGAVRNEMHKLGAALRVIREGREAAAECAGDGLELALGWVLEEVPLDDARNEFLVREALVEAKLRNEANLSEEPLLAGDGALVREVWLHRLRLP